MGKGNVTLDPSHRLARGVVGYQLFEDGTLANGEGWWKAPVVTPPIGVETYALIREKAMNPNG